MGFFFRQMNGDEALAADLTQDAFLRVWTARDRFSGTSFRTWLLTIGYNLVKNHFRHSGHQREYEQLLVQTEQEETDNSIMEKMEKDAFDQALRQLLEKMPPESRLLFSFRFEEELTVPEIANLMEIPEGTVKSRLHILTQTLKQKFNQYDHIRR
jgi:RNA polymerase sigma-70 factor (ECF subfamily)